MKSLSETRVFLAYFCCYFLYLFVRQEGEFLHWVSLVLLPLVFVFYAHRDTAHTLRAVLASVGISQSNCNRGWAAAILVGLAFCGLQLFAARTRNEILEIAQSGSILYLFPITLLLMMILAGFTEEFFFRGVLQTRLRTCMPPVLAIFTCAFLFGAYHLPYAYLNPAWPSHGDWTAALGAAFGQGLPIGLLLGWLYHRSENLLACVVCHALINTLPGMVQVARWFR